MARMIDVVPNKGGGISSSLLRFLSSEYVMGILMLVGICVCVCDSNIDYRFMLVFPQSSEEDITSVSIVGWIINWRIDCCIRIVGLSGIKGSSRTAAGLKSNVRYLVQ
jgi:hypothetical protein